MLLVSCAKGMVSMLYHYVFCAGFEVFIFKHSWMATFTEMSSNTHEVNHVSKGLVENFAGGEGPACGQIGRGSLIHGC